LTFTNIILPSQSSFAVGLTCRT